MTKITLHGNAINTKGTLPPKGKRCPDFRLTRNDLTDVTLENYTGKRKVLNIFPSIDTPVCAASVRKFNLDASHLENTVILNISADLPFAQARFCGAEGIKNVEVLSTFRSSFADDFNLKIIDPPLAGLCSRAIIVLNEKNEVIYTEQVAEIASEPNYKNALESLAH